jgi:hypothetical protein
VLPKSIDDNGDEESSSSDIKLTRLFKSRRVVFGLIYAAMAYFIWGYFEPVLALRLNEFNVSTIIIGIIFAVNSVSYVIGAPML